MTNCVFFFSNKLKIWFYTKSGKYILEVMWGGGGAGERYYSGKLLDIYFLLVLQY